MKVSLHSAVMVGWCFAVVSLPFSAIAGPPFRTDDPEPVDYQHWEFYTFTSGTHVNGDTSGVGPAIEFNYGLIPNGMVHIVVPTAFDSPAGGPTLFGLGDVELGFKYRFIEQEKDGSRPSIGAFPLVELPSGDQSRGLGAGYVRAFLPVWVQKDFGDPRRTEIIEDTGEINLEDLVAVEDMAVTVTHGGYLKRTAVDTTRPRPISAVSQPKSLSPTAA